MKRTSLYILISISIIGCSTSTKSRRELQKIVKGNSIEKNPLGFLYQSDTLTLSAKFSECGEFGGHKEKIEIFCNYKREYFARFTRDSIDLDCPNDFEVKAVIIKDTSFKINIRKEKIILKYLDRLYKRAITNKMLSHSNDYFNAKTKYSGLSLFTAEPKKDWDEFRKLQIELTR